MTTIFDFSSRVILNVTTTEDQNDGSEANGLSLRDAILQANANPSKEYIINLPAGFYNLTIQNILQPPAIDDTTPDLPTLIESRKTTGDLDISGRITIIGEDPANTVISASGLQRFFTGTETIIDLGDENLNRDINFSSFNTRFTVGDRIFDVASGANLTLENVTVQDGVLIENRSVRVDVVGQDERSRLIEIGNIDTSPNGAGINVETGGRLVLNNTIVKSNQTEAKGGGINNAGTTIINDSIIKTNESKNINTRGLFVRETKTGGGIFNSGTLTINRSSIINNFVQSAIPTDIEGAGAGITNEAGGIVTIVNTSILGNNAGVDAGGGLLTRGRATIINSTIVDNTAQVGGGIYSETTGANTVINNSIVAKNKVQTTFVEDINVDFPRSNLNEVTGVGFIDEFILDILDEENSLIQPPPEGNVFRDSFYSIRVLYRNEDPFSTLPPEGLDVTSTVNLNNLIFNTSADIEFVFNDYSGGDLDNFFRRNNGFSGRDDNLISNVDQNFGFAYRDNSDNLVFLETEFDFDEEGKLVLVLKDFNLATSDNFNQKIFLADKQEVFQFSTFNNNLLLDNANKSQAPFFRDSNNQVPNFFNVVNFERRKVGEFVTNIPNPPLSTDVDGFFAGGSSFNLIGSSSANGIVDRVNNNIVGSTSNPLDPKLQAVLNDAGDIIGYLPLEGSLAINAGNNGIVELRQFFSTEPVDQFGNSRINDGRVDIGSVESGFSNLTLGKVLSESDSLLNQTITRFRSSLVSGTYLYTTNGEINNVLGSFAGSFVEEGEAFKVATQPADGLIAINRFHNTSVPGTYLFATEAESNSIRQNFTNFVEEGIAFYVYGADSNRGEDIYRFHNLAQPGTYLFVGEQEKNNIINNPSLRNFVLEGVAFEVG